MKKFLFIVVLMAFAGMAFAKDKEAQAVKVLSTKRHILYFKSDKGMKGAVVEIIDFKGRVVETLTVEKSKTIVDFFFLPSGEYTVRIKKDEQLITIPYSNI